jgi:hypothetical protein
VTEQYETLRAAILGESLPAEARSGLALLLRRGMWSWARAAGAPNATRQLTRSSLPRSTSDDEQRVVVRLIAAIVMRSNDRRTHERIAQSPDAPP